MDLEAISYMGSLDKRKRLMTKDLFFDTDCISSFLWVKREDILIKLYPAVSRKNCVAQASLY